MNLRQIKLVYFKEMKDILRDKRTIRLMILVPVVFYPLMSLGLGGLVEGGAVRAVACVVDEDVEATGLGLDLLEGASDARWIRHVELHGTC